MGTQPFLPSHFSTGEAAALVGNSQINGQAELLQSHLHLTLESSKAKC